MADITHRALTVLGEVDRIAAEDTRTTGNLLARYGIDTPTLRHEKHNEARSTEGLIQLLEAGESIALVSDAGTPAVSDPGARLVRAAHQAGIHVLTIPGPSALVAAFSVSGLELPLTFHGFFPKKKEARATRIASLLPGSHAFYCPGRDLARVLHELGGQQVVVGRELTKMHEQTLVGEATEVADRLTQAGALKGEAVLLIQVIAHQEVLDDDAIRLRVQTLMQDGMRTKDAAAQVAQALDLPRRRVYRLALDSLNSEERHDE